MNRLTPIRQAVVPFLLASVAMAEVHTFEVCCNGPQEVPPFATVGSAALTVVVDDVASTVQVSGTFQNLMGDISFAVMHGPALPDQLGGGLLSLSVTGTTSGTVSANATVASSTVQTILDGLAYIDLHSAFGPAGEIRGQIASNGPTYCVASPNSVGSGALLRVAGCRIAADQNVVLHVTGLPQGVPGLFYFGPTQVGTPFGDGTRCVGGATLRVYPFSFADGAGQVTRALNFSAGYGSGIAAGTNQNFQFWYRDGANGGAGFNTSSAVSVDFL